MIGAFTTDRNLVVQVWDPILAGFTGIAPEAVKGRPLLAVVPDLESRGLKKYFDHVLENGVVEVLAPAFHHYLIRCAPTRPSKRFPAMRQRVTIAPLTQESRIAGVIVTIEDVTALHDNEFDLLQSENWKVRRAAVDAVSRNSAPEAISALLLWVRDNHHNLGLLNSALQVLTLCNVDTHTTLVDFLKGPDADLRIQAALALGQLGNSSDVQALMEALKDPDVNVVYHAIEALGRVAALEAVEPLIAIAETCDFFLAYPALEALGKIGDSRAAARIVPLLENELLRDAAAHTLATLGDETIVTTLVGMLNASKSAPTVIAASLAVLHDRYQRNFGEGRHIADLCRLAITPTGIQHLLDALPESSPHDVRSLLLVLGWQESPAAMRAVTLYLGRAEVRGEIIDALAAHGASVTELLLPCLTSEDLEIRLAAISAIGRIKDRRAVPALIDVLVKDPELSIAAIAALAAIGDRRAVDPLFALLGTTDAALRRATVGALSALASPEMIPRVTTLMEDENPAVREAAVRIAGYFGYDKSIEALLRRCEDGDATVRRAAVEHLPYLEDARAAATLLRVLRNDTPQVRAAAAAAAAHLDSPESVRALMEALGDPDPWVRYFAARALGKHGTKNSAEALYGLARNDRAPHVRIAAFEALQVVDLERATAVAKAFLDNDDIDLARAVAASLARLPHEKTSRTSSLLMDVLRSPHAAVRATAATALGDSRNPEALTTLRSLAVNDKEPSVRDAAILALNRLATPEATAALIDLLDTPTTQQTAMTALSQPAGFHMASLTQGFQHPSTAVRVAMVGVVERIKRLQTVDLLRQALHDPHPAVRVAAAGALNRQNRQGQ